MSIEPFSIQRGLHPDAPGVVAAVMEQGGRAVVVLDEGLLQRLEVTLRAIPRDAQGFVLASAAPRAFVAGADLASIQAMDDPTLHRYLEFGARVFQMIADLPMPTAAAIRGATLGGGLELAMHCDGLIGGSPKPKPDGSPSRPYPVGLPEAGLAICPGWGGTNLLPARMDAAKALELTAAGTPMNFDEASDAGLFDAVAGAQDDLLAVAAQWVANQRTPTRDGAPSRHIARAAAKAAVLEAFDASRSSLETTQAGAACVRATDAGLTQGWSAALQTERDELVRLRNTPEARERIEAFFAQSKGAKKG